MIRRMWLLPAALLLSLLLSACGDDGSTPSATSSGDTPQAGGTENAPDTPGEDGEEATPTEFEALRDALRDQLDAIGASIGHTPNDIRRQLLDSCRELGNFVDADRVEPICQDIDDSIERGDPGKIDLVLDHLADLAQD